jgi:hypothetical protein
MPVLSRYPIVASAGLVAAVLAVVEMLGRDVPLPAAIVGGALLLAAWLLLPQRPLVSVLLLPIAFAIPQAFGEGSQSLTPAVLTLLAAVFRLGEFGARREWLIGLAWVVLTGQVATVLAGTWYPGDILFGTTVYGLPLWLGHTVRTGREAQAELEARTLDLVHARERRAELEVERERARLAERVNGVVTGALRRMVEDADRGLAALPGDRLAAADTLEAIEVVGREALSDMRALLGVLREEREAA